jgi:hypothetical protein
MTEMVVAVYKTARAASSCADGSHWVPDRDSRLPTPAELRKQAARAHDLAAHLIGDEAEARLLKLAGELEAKATAMEEPPP